MYSIAFTRDAANVLRKMPRNVAHSIRGKLDALAADPHAPNNNVTKLQGRDGYRLRVGDWRVLYDLDDGIKVLAVKDIGPRGGIYR